MNFKGHFFEDLSKVDQMGDYEVTTAAGGDIRVAIVTSVPTQLSCFETKPAHPNPSDRSQSECLRFKPVFTLASLTKNIELRC